MKTNFLCQWAGLPQKRFPIIFHGVLGKDEREEKSPSFFNRSEATIVMNYVRNLLEERSLGIKPSEIGIISPYKQQVSTLRHLWVPERIVLKPLCFKLILIEFTLTKNSSMRFLWYITLRSCYSSPAYTIPACCCRVVSWNDLCWVGSSKTLYQIAITIWNAFHITYRTKWLSLYSEERLVPDTCSMM